MRLGLHGVELKLYVSVGIPLIVRTPSRAPRPPSDVRRLSCARPTVRVGHSGGPRCAS